MTTISSTEEPLSQISPLSVSSGDSEIATIDGAGVIESVDSTVENTESVVVDTTIMENQLEQIHNDLVGVTTILQFLFTFVIAFFIWTILRTVYKFLDSMF